jgi:hypothetical protein
MKERVNNKSSRRFNTENSEAHEGDYNHYNLFNATARDQINKKENNLFQKLNVEQKLYKRIKTEQVVFENRKKKIYIENEDLI